MRVLQSKDLPLKQTLVYSYGKYRERVDETVTPAEIATALHFTIPTTNRLLIELHNKGLVEMKQDELLFIEPTSQHFRFGKNGAPMYFKMSLVIEGSANETAVLYYLNHLFKIGYRKQTSLGLAHLLHLGRRTIEEIIKRLERKGMVKVKRSKDGFTILEIAIREKAVRKKPEQAPAKVRHLAAEVTEGWEEGTHGANLFQPILDAGVPVELAKHWNDLTVEWAVGQSAPVLPWDTLDSLSKSAMSHHRQKNGNTHACRLIEHKVNEYLKARKNEHYIYHLQQKG